MNHLHESSDNNNSKAGVPGLLGKLGQMTSIRDTEMLEQSLLRTLGPLVGVLDTALYRTDERQHLVRVTHYHRSKMVETDGVERMVERIEEVHNLADIPAETVSLTNSVSLLHKPCTRRHGAGFVIAYPVFGKSEVCGYFVFKRDREVSPQEDVTIRGVLEVFSNYYALLDISRRDRLTGLLNRQALESSFDRLWSLLARMGSGNERETRESLSERREALQGSYWLAVIDIDHFKRVNDSYGHMVGDEILLLVSRLMAAALRASDLLYRYGGEEFVAIVSAENAAAANRLFERVRVTIECAYFPQVENITISIGYVQINANVLPVEVLARADRSLYQAKNDGRNRTYDYESLLKAGVFRVHEHNDVELF